MSDGKKKGQRGGDQSEIKENKKDERIDGQGQRRVIVQDAVIFQILHFLFPVSHFNADRAKMSASEFNVAKRAQESPAVIATHYSFLLAMIKAACFFRRNDSLACLSGSHSLDKGRKGIRVRFGFASGTWNESIHVKQRPRQTLIASWTYDGVHLVHSLLSNDPCIADHIMQSFVLFFVKCDHQIPDITNEFAE